MAMFGLARWLVGNNWLAFLAGVLYTRFLRSTSGSHTLISATCIAGYSSDHLGWVGMVEGPHEHAGHSFRDLDRPGGVL